jgi:acyl carrier protein
MTAYRNEDERLWAARIRLHFEPELRDTAEGIAAVFVTYTGSRIKLLRPETRLLELLSWVKETPNGSLDAVELVMGLEDSVGAEITDEFAEQLEDHTFRELVHHMHRRRTKP